MRNAFQRLACPLLLVGLLWVLAGVLEDLARNDWLGPVVRGSLEGRIDAGALFYTEVDMEARTTSEAPTGE